MGKNRGVARQNPPAGAGLAAGLRRNADDDGLCSHKIKKCAAANTIHLLLRVQNRCYSRDFSPTTLRIITHASDFEIKCKKDYNMVLCSQ